MRAGPLPRSCLAAMRALQPIRFGARLPLYAAGFPFLLLWSHKAASTALAQWFFAQAGSPQLRQGGADAAKRYAGLGIHAYQFEVHGSGFAYRYHCRRALAGALPVVKFVRDPAARAFSAFLASRRGIVTERPAFWGARVSRAVLGRRGTTDAGAPYSFCEFVDWLAATPQAQQDPHVGVQWMPFEAGRDIEIVPTEGLVERLGSLERRFGLPALAARPGLLSSGHHRPDPLPMDAGALEAFLGEPVFPGRFDGQPAPAVDSALLRATVIGERLREVLSADYRAYPVY